MSFRRIDAFGEGSDNMQAGRMPCGRPAYGLQNGEVWLKNPEAYPNIRLTRVMPATRASTSSRVL